MGLYSVELEPNSFDDLVLGGEWTTRRRTISESEIALFAALAGDFSPLSVDTSGGGTRLAQPALLVAMAAGLGSMDMPIPNVAAWEWLNWKFPRAVRAGETIYARWTLTQKRPPVGGSPTAIAVWRVDVHTADGALCAEGEVGASVVRHATAAAERPAEASGPNPQARPRRRRRRTPQAAEPPEVPQTPPERAAGPRRRRRRRSGSPAASNGESSPAGPAPEPVQPATATPAAMPSAAAPPGGANPVPPAGGPNPLSRVMRRLRGT